MNINVTYDSSVSSAPAQFIVAITYVVSLFDSLFTNPVTINIDVGWGEISGQLLGSGILGESQESAAPAYSYGTVKNAFISTANASGDPSQLAAASTLPTTDPTSGGTFDLGTANAKALGLIAGNSSAIDGYVGFSSSVSWSFIADATPAANAYYFIGVAEHEISEVMGRDAILGGAYNYFNAYTLMDLFRYSASGVRDLSPGSPNSAAYFSINNGATNLGSWNNDASNGDLGDWYPGGPAPGGNDAFNDYSNSGVVGALTTTDVTLMNVLGWDTSIGPTDVPNGVTGWVASGQTSSGFVVLSGGYMEVGSGGIAIATTLSGGGMHIDAAGTASGTTVSSGGTETVSSGGTSFVALVMDGGVLNILSGGVASGITDSGGADVISGGTVSGTAVRSRGVEAVFSGGRSLSATVLGGGVQYVLSGGTARGTTDSGGADIVLAGGVESGTRVSSGGTEVVSSGGRSISATLLVGGVQYVLSGGTASGTTDSGGADIVHAGGVESGTRVSSGGTEVASSGGTLLSTTVLAGGVQYVLSGGTASGTTDGGGADIVLAGGVESGTRVSSGGTEVASSGGSLLSTTVLAGGVQYVLSGGVASGTTDSGGVDFILNGGIENGTRVSSGGTEVVSSGGTSLSASILAGGVEFVVAGGVASATTINGGNEQVLSGGMASGTTVSNGGFLTILAGGTVNGATISGATVEIASGGLTGSNPISYAGGAALILDASMTFSGTVAGLALGDFLDLRDISFISGTTSATFAEAGSNTSGTLTVSDGTHSANLTLLGQYVTAQFNVASDGHNGTLVTDPPLTVATEQQGFLTQPRPG